MDSRQFIVVGVDESWQRTGALEWALDEALLSRTPLRAVHVIQGWARYTPYYSPVEIDGETFTPIPLEEAAAKLLEDVAAHVATADPRLDLDVDAMVGPPAEKLTELSADARMVVVGHRGLGLFGRLVIGSTSEGVATHGEGPVVVVPDDWKPADHRGGPITVGVDGYPESEAALEFAFEAAEVHQVPVRMVHVWDVPNVYARDAPTFAGAIERWETIANERLAEIADQWHNKHPDVEIQQDVRRSHPVLGLLAAVTEAKPQLLVLGGRRHNRVTSTLLGSVARRVLHHHTTCPIAVVHARREP